MKIFKVDICPISIKFILAFILLIISTSLFGQFRSTKWGMTTSQVSAKETQKCAPLIQGTETYFCGFETIQGFDFEIFYSYQNNKLYRGGYSIFFKPEGNNEVILNLFKDTSNLIGEKYGKKLTISHETKFEGGSSKEVYSFEFVVKETRIKGICEFRAKNITPSKQIIFEYLNTKHNSREADKDKF